MLKCSVGPGDQMLLVQVWKWSIRLRRRDCRTVMRMWKCPSIRSLWRRTTTWTRREMQLYASVILETTACVCVCEARTETVPRVSSMFHCVIAVHLSSSSVRRMREVRANSSPVADSRSFWQSTVWTVARSNLFGAETTAREPIKPMSALGSHCVSATNYLRGGEVSVRQLGV